VAEAAAVPTPDFGGRVLQPRIIILDPAGGGTIPYARLVARLQPLALRIETSLEKALVAIAGDAWDVGVVTARGGTAAAVLHSAVRQADPQLPLVVIDPDPSVDTARACLKTWRTPSNGS
jgi:hypothetical protein